MTQQLKPALLMLTLFTCLTGIAYPLLVTFGAQILFPNEANGSLIVSKEHFAGSELIGQPFTRPEYFWGRPSATSPSAYNASASSGSNLGPTNPHLVAVVRERIANLRKYDPNNNQSIPVDLVTASASGLDPHISPAAALFQVSRIALARQVPIVQVQTLINNCTETRQWGVLGEPRLNVLVVNLAMDSGTTCTK